MVIINTDWLLRVNIDTRIRLMTSDWRVVILRYMTRWRHETMSYLGIEQVWILLVDHHRRI